MDYSFVAIVHFSILYSCFNIKIKRYVHSKGIIFADLKPSNILLDGYGLLKMSDFGLAQILKEIKQQDSTTLQNEIKPPTRGTPHYMAPVLHVFLFYYFSHSVPSFRNYLLVGVFQFILIYGH